MASETFFGQFKDRVLRQIKAEEADRNRSEYQDPEGRYLSICLREALDENPRLATRLLGIGRGEHVFKTEHTYSSSLQRRADIAVLKKHDATEHLALIELKMEDHFGRGQLRDYLNYCDRHSGVRFIIISRYPLAEKEYRIIRSKLRPNRFRALTVRDLYGVLSETTTKDTPVTDLLLAFLGESEMHYSTEIPKALKYLAYRLFLGGGGSDAKKTDALLLDGIPEAFRGLSTNLKIVTDVIYREARYRGKGLSQNPWRDIWFSQEHRKRDFFDSIPIKSIRSKCESNHDSYKSTVRAIIKHDDYLINEEHLSRSIDFGNIWFYTTLTVERGAQIQFGFYLGTCRSNNGKKNCELAAYACVLGDVTNSDGSWPCWREMPFAESSHGWKLHCEDDMVTWFRKNIEGSRSAFIKRYGDKGKASRFPKQFKIAKKLKHFTWTE